jgi:hypothetical protein
MRQLAIVATPPGHRDRCTGPAAQKPATCAFPPPYVDFCPLGEAIFFVR